MPSGREALGRVLPGAESLDVAVAFVTASGVRVLQELFVEFGKPTRVRVVVRGAPVTDPDAVLSLAELGAEVRVVMGERAPRFHPKLWLASSDRALHVLSGSGNLTAGGLVQNDEQFELLRLPLPAEAREANAQAKRWDEFFALGSPLADAVWSPAWAEWVAQRSRRRRLAEELARLDRRLATKQSSSTRRSSRGANTRRAPSVDDFDPTWLRRVLQKAVGKRHAAEISRPAWGPRAQVDVGDDRGLKYLFLMPDDADEDDRPSEICLKLYPGDTLRQARQFYPRVDSRGQSRLIDLDATAGWSVEPNFHLGLRTRGWLPSKSPAGLADYLEYWHAHIDEHRQRPAHEWPAVLNRLARAGMVSRDYPTRFREQVGGHALVHPRPGLVITRTWPLVSARHLDLTARLPGEVWTAAEHALKQIGEPPLPR